jgi:predicted nucleic acid-binding protein
VLDALRRMSIHRDLSEERATDARTDVAELAIVRYPHEPLNDRVWELRHNLTAYDATFIALAEALDATAGSAGRTALYPAARQRSSHPHLQARRWLVLSCDS